MEHKFDFSKKNTLSIILLLLVGNIYSLAAQSEKETLQLEAYAKKLDSLRQAHHIPGLAAAIVKDQKVLWAEGFGMSHFDTGDGAVYRRVNPDTPFWIASVTKPFVSLLFLQLEEEGILNLDDKINELPGWDNFCNWLSQSKIVFGENLKCDLAITLRQVLTHTVNGEPGTTFRYNPLMYSRLSRYLEYIYGNSVAEVEGRHNTMAQLMQKNILGPAGMDRSMSSQWQIEKVKVFLIWRKVINSKMTVISNAYGQKGILRAVQALSPR